MKQKPLRKRKKQSFMRKIPTWQIVFFIAIALFLGYTVYKNIPPSLSLSGIEPLAADAATGTSMIQLRERIHKAAESAKDNAKNAGNPFVLLRSTKEKYARKAELALQAGAINYATAASYYGAEGIDQLDWNPSQDKNLRARVSSTVLDAATPKQKTIQGIVTPVMNEDRSVDSTYGLGIRQVNGSVIKISSTTDNAFPPVGTPVSVTATDLSQMPKPSILSIRGSAPYNTASTAFTTGNTVVAGSAQAYQDQLSSGESILVIPVGSTDAASAKTNAQKVATFFSSQTGGKKNLTVEMGAARQDCNGDANASYVFYVTSSFTLPGCTSFKGPYPATISSAKILVPNNVATMAHELGHALGLVGYYEAAVIDSDGHIGASILNIMNTNGSFNILPPLTAAQIAKITNGTVSSGAGSTTGSGSQTGSTGAPAGGSLGNPPPVPAGTAMNCPSPINAAPGTSFTVPITGTGNSFAAGGLISVDRAVSKPGWLRPNPDPSLPNNFVPGGAGQFHLEVGNEAPEGATGTIGLYVLITNYVQGGTWDYNPIKMTCSITVRINSQAGNPYPPVGVTPNQQPGVAKGPNGLYVQLELLPDGRPLHGNFCGSGPQDSTGGSGCTTESFERDYVNPPNTPSDPNSLVIQAGANVVVRWTSEKATRCQVSPNDWSGVVGSGSLVNVQNYTVVRISCSNAQGETVTASRSIEVFGQATSQPAGGSVCQPAVTTIGIPLNAGATEREFTVDMIFANGTNLTGAQTTTDFVQLAENPRLEYRSSSISGSTIKHLFRMYIPAGPYKRGVPQAFINVTRNGQTIGRCEVGATYEVAGNTPGPGNPLLVSPALVQVAVGETKTVKITGGDAPYTVGSNVSTANNYWYYADASVDGDTVSITGTNPGDTTVIVKDSLVTAFGSRFVVIGVKVLPGTTTSTGGSTGSGGSGSGSTTGGGQTGGYSGATSAGGGKLTLTRSGSTVTATVPQSVTAKTITITLDGNQIGYCEKDGENKIYSCSASLASMPNGTHTITAAANLKLEFDPDPVSLQVTKN